MKELLKSLYICQSYCKNKSGTLFETQRRLAHVGGGREGNVLHHVKMEGNCPGGINVGGEYVRGENVRIPLSM